MPALFDRIRNHPVLPLLKELAPLFKSARRHVAESPERAEYLERVRRTVTLATKLLKNADPLVTPPNVVDQIHSYSQPLASEFRAFEANGAFQNLVNANSHAENLLPLLPQLRAAAPDVEHATDAIAEVTTTAASMIQQLHEQVSKIDKVVDGVMQRITDQRAEIDAQKGRVDSLIATTQEQFGIAESDRLAKFAKSQEDRAAETVRVLAELSDSVERAKKAAATNAAAMLDDLDAQLVRAKGIVGIISETGLVGGFKIVADEESGSRNRWRWLAAASMMLLVAFSLWAFYDSRNATSVSWWQASSRLFVAVTLGILAAFAARQSERHAANERHVRRSQLELAALDPFLESLPPDERHPVKKALAERLFAQPEPTATIRHADTSGTVKDLIGLIQELIKDRQ